VKRRASGREAEDRESEGQNDQSGPVVCEPDEGHLSASLTKFLERWANGKVDRIAIPPHVADTIARQRDSLSTKLRKKIGKANAQARKAQGLKPGFQMSAEERAAAKRARRKGGEVMKVSPGRSAMWTSTFCRRAVEGAG
jgi:hypothetical protein